MSNLVLVPMTSERYEMWVLEQIEDYAADKIKAGIWPEWDARERSAAEMAQNLPDGVTTADHHLFVATVDGEEIGNVWLWADPASDGREVFIYNIEVYEPYRGRGLGRQLLRAAQQWAVDRGVESVRLNVFTHNSTAYRLYESEGYRTTNRNMVKRVTS